MIKKNINVIDLDKTLIPYDSFRVLIKKDLYKFDLFVVLFTFLRVFRLISMKNYKKHLIKHLQKKHKTIYFKKFAKKLNKDIDKDVLSLVYKETDDKTINILLSASPDIFVKYLIEKLNWKGKGSYFDEKEKFAHLYGKEKINWLQKNYSNKIYNYNFAISDSASDEELLSFFDKNIMWKS